MEDNGFDIKSLVSQHFRHVEKDEKIDVCPEEETLHDYLNEKLSPDIKKDVERHLSQCEMCTQTLLCTIEILEDGYVPKDSDVPGYVKKRVRSLIPPEKGRFPYNTWETLKKRGLEAWAYVRDMLSLKNPEFVYVRGTKKIISKNLVVLEKVFKDIKLMIEIEKINSSASDIKIKASHPQTGALLHGVRINLNDGSREIASFVTSHGEVLFEQIVFGNYRLIAWQDKKKLGEVLLSIKE